jgi:hypothetical protein
VKETFFLGRNKNETFIWFDIIGAAMRLKILFAGILCALAALAYADEITSAAKLSLTLSTLPEAKIKIARSVSVPFLRGDHALTENNAVSAEIAGEITPVSIAALGEIVWSPAAFFELTSGAQFGSGWNIRLGGWEVRGIGVNKRGADGGLVVEGSAFDGLLWNARIGGTLMFDFAAIFPGDWRHVVLSAYNECMYAGYSGAAKNDSWFFEGDSGENRNGWNYYGCFIAGYQMPLFLDAAALMAEIKSYLYDTPHRERWGDDLPRWTFSAVFNFKVAEKISARLIAQCRTERNFTAATAENEFYQDRRIETPAQRLEFYRAAAIMTFRLR